MAVRHRASTICVLGGTGFVGRSLVGLLVRRGYRVIVPSRAPERHRDLWVLPGTARPAIDVHDEAALAGVLVGCAAVVNLIGILNERGHAGAEFERVHAELAAKLVRACRSAGVRRLLQMSALKADAHHGPSFYLRTKGRAEESIKAAGDLAWTLFRPSAIFGPDDSFTNRFARLLRRLWVLPLPRGAARFAPVYVEDVARAFAVALEDSTAHGRTFELCGPDIFSLEEIVRLIGNTQRLRRRVWCVPDALGRVQAWLGEYVLPGKPLSMDNYRSLTVAAVCSTDGLAALGIQPRSLPALLPTYLGGAARQRRLARLRSAGRS
jgi:NADH dehydrogenase